MITYNHARYIAQAIESVLGQRASFPFELVIGEDCSTDGTRAIVRDYAARFPHVVRALLPERNLGMTENGRTTLAACRGEFIANLEGDDYWTSSEKLERQVGLLSANPGYSACCHDAMMISGGDGSVLRNYCDPKPPPLLSVGDLLAWNCVPTCSLVYRRRLIEPRPAFLHKTFMQDWPTNILLAQRGPIAFVDETWAAYRIHAAGAWSSLSPARRWSRIIEMYAAIATELNPADRSRLRVLMKDARHKLVRDLAMEGDFGSARREAWRYLLSVPRCLRPPRGHNRYFVRLLLGLVPRPSSAAR